MPTATPRGRRAGARAVARRRRAGSAPAHALESYANSAELSGELAEAARAWREICAVLGPMSDRSRSRGRAAPVPGRGPRPHRRPRGGTRRAARRGRGVCRRRPARRRGGRAPGDGELPPRAGRIQRGDQADPRRRRCGGAGRLDLRARALGLEGVARAKRGDSAAGLKAVREGLALAIDHDLTPVAAELYQRLSLVLYDSADYRAAQETLDTALELCEATGRRRRRRVRHLHGVRAARVRRVAEALELGAEVIAAARGRGSPRGSSAPSTSTRASSARAPDADVLVRDLLADRPLQHDGGHADRPRPARRRGGRRRRGGASAAGRLLARWERSEDHHYAVRGLRWSAAVPRGARRPARRARLRRGPRRIASAPGTPTPSPALAHAIGETALAHDDAAGAAEQLGDGGRPPPDAGRAVRARRDRAARRRRAGRRRRARRRRSSAWTTRTGTRAGSGPPPGGRDGARGRRPSARRSPPARAPRGGRRGRGRAVAAGARGRPAGRGGAHQPRDRARAVPEPSDRRHARPQHPAPARVPVAGGGRPPRRGAGPASP